MTVTKLRTIALVFALILALQAVWILLPEILSPSTATPSTPSAETTDLAARIGWLRGDLWADYALALNPQFPSLIEGSASQPNRAIAEYAAATAPFDSRVWLLLAELDASPSSPSSEAQLKMSFYTAPDDMRLIPSRIILGAQLNVASDDELQYQIEQQMRAIILKRADQKSVIATAYARASPSGRHFIETKLAELDPKFLAELKGAAH